MRPTDLRRGVAHRSRVWTLRTRDLPLDPPLVMGILNLTPDSFSDGGRNDDLSTQLSRAQAMVEAGAAIIDVGGESTRPGAGEVDPDEEIRRILPFIKSFVAEGTVPLSVDTRKAGVAAAALEAGAEIVNDVSGLRFDPAMAGVVAEAAAGLVVMHMRGTPDDMATRAEYVDVIAEVRAELAGSVELARRAGVEDRRMVLDPGLGFAKSPEQTLRVLAGLDEFGELGFPVLVGPSRKSFIGAVSGATASDRLPGTLAACVMAFERGATIFRVHDPAEVVQALAVARAVLAGRLAESPPGPTGPDTRSVAGSETLR